MSIVELGNAKNFMLGQYFIVHLVMSIVGGALFPLIMGWISDATGGNIQLSYIVPMLCFAVVFFFALGQKVDANSPRKVVPILH